MNKTLRKRVFRDLKQNIGRYIALTLLIVMGIYLVLSMVGSGESITRGTDDRKSVNLVEDGEFTVFLPLTDDEIEELSEGGNTIEAMFYTDMEYNGTTLRMFRNRQNINLLQIDEGVQAESMGEAVIEKRYSEENEISVGDEIEILGRRLKITGIGTVPDYDLPVASFGDSAADSSAFGIIFVCDEQYDDIRSEESLNAEEYVYAYRLGDGITDSEIKDRIKALDFDYTKVEDVFFRESIDDVLAEREEISDGIDDLNSGAKELYEGVDELDSHSSELNEFSAALFSYYLSQIDLQLSSMGVSVTEDNYKEVLAPLAENSDTAAELLESLTELDEFCGGIKEYTDGVGEVKNGTQELYDGIAELTANVDELLDEAFDIDIDNLVEFITADENTRIAGAANDVKINKIAGLFAGIIVLVLFTYVISVFVVHQIENESSVIGSLYALGVKKGDLLRHYITLPTIVAFIGGVIGTAIAYTPIGAEAQMSSSYAYYSFPQYDVVFPAYLIAYGVILPPIISAAVNALVINRKLSKTALSLIRNEQKTSSYKDIRIKSQDFVKRFRIRQLIRESRTGVTVVLGMFISLMILMIGLNCWAMCDSIKVDNLADTKYEYMYLYKYPEETPPEGSEEAYIEGLKIDCMGNSLDVSVIGITSNSRYFDADVEKGVSKAVINSSLADRYSLGEGDVITLTESVEGRNYTFTITGVADYSPSFTVFMDIESMRELFGREDDYFNAVYSDTELDIDKGRLYSVTTKDDIEKSSAVFFNIMQGMVSVFIAAGAAIFCVVMYLMLGVMIDRSSYGISLAKIFGYNSKEIRRLYLDGTFFIIAAGGLICIPLSKYLIDKIYPLFISNVACSMNLTFPWYLYVGIYAAMLVIYLVINRSMIRRINKITPAEVLKNRE
ncbi:MAG: ABC transporter permease [Ruminococcus sp.]|nr:ABC transporter permease [Ruminococcus sp.]